MQCYHMGLWSKEGEHSVMWQRPSWFSLKEILHALSRGKHGPI